MPKRRIVQARKQSSPLAVTAIAVLLVVGILAYSNSLEGPFVFDDLDEIADNPHVQITALTPTDLWNAAWRSPSPTRPVANVTFALNYYIGGRRTVGYHVANLAIHLTCGVFVFFLARETFSRANVLPDQARRPAAIGWMSLTAALLFICHPLQIQAVTYIVQRMSSLATLFYLAALLFYVRGRIAVQPKRRAVLWSGAGLCWLGSLGTKEIAVSLPLAVLLYEWFFFQNLSLDWLKRCLKYVVPIGALLVAFVLIAGGAALRQTLFGTYSLRDYTLGERVLTELRVVVFYLSLVIWPMPWRLSLTHDITISRGLFDPITTALSLTLLLGLLLVAILAARRYRILSFGILWFFLQLALESSVLPLELVYEHRMYLPMVGLSLLVSWALFAELPTTSKSLAVVTGIIVALAMATHVRNEAWADSRTLWADVVAKYPANPRAHNNLGLALAQRGDYPRALRHWRESIESDPNYAEAYYNIGFTRAIQGNFADAEANYRKAIEVDQTYFPAYNNLGALLASQRKEVEATEYFRRAIEINPEFAAAHNNLGNALASQGKPDEAIAHFRRALELDPRIADAHFSLGSLSAESGSPNEAEWHYRQALALAQAQGESELAKMIEAALQALPHNSP